MTRARRRLVQAASASLEAPASTVSPMKKVVTEDDRSDNIAKGLAAVSRDLQTIMVANKQHIQMLKDCNRLNRNMKKVVSQLEESSIDALAVIEKHINCLLSSSNKSTKAKWLNSRLVTVQNHAIRVEMYLYGAHGCVAEEETVIERVKRIINPHTTTSGIASHVLGIVPLAIKPTGRLKVKNVTRKSQRNKHSKGEEVRNKNMRSYPFHVDTDDEHGNPIRIFRVSSLIEYTLPRPKRYPILYEVNEALVMLKPYYGKPGFQYLTSSLHKAGMLGYAKQAFGRIMKLHSTTNGRYFVPDEFQVMPHMGRSALMLNADICRTHNVLAHANASMVTDGKDDARDALHKEIMKQAKAAGITLTEEIWHDEATISNYDFFARTEDANISTVRMATTRLKSWSRRIAARSFRTWATTVCTNILSQYVPGIWVDKPNDMTKGAEEAYELALKWYGCPVRPVKARHIINHDGSGALRTAGKQTKGKKNTRGKISSQALWRDFRKTSSKWSAATAEDSKFIGVGIELKKITCGAGLNGKDVHLVKKIPYDRMSKNMVILDIQGMGACQDMNPDSKNYSFLVFTRAGGVDDLTSESVGSQFSRWYHENVVLKFIEDLRRTDTSFNWEPGAPVPPEYRAVLKFDGEMTYTGLLKQLEVASNDSRAQIVYVKIAGGYTECGQANDKSVGFKNDKHFNRILTDIYNEESQMKSLLNAEFDRLNLQKILILTTNQRSAIVDYLCISREVDRLSNSNESIRMGYVSTGELSKSTDGSKYYPCPDLDAMINSNKNNDLKRDREKYKKMLYPVGLKMKEDGHAFDKWFDEQENDDPSNYFPKDTLEDGIIVVEKKCSNTAYHEQRGMLMNWPSILENLKRLEDECKMKVLNAKRKRNQKLLDQFGYNEKAEAILRKLSCLGENAVLDSCTEDNFENGQLKKDHLIAFIWLRSTVDLEDGGNARPTYNRGTYKDIQNGKTGPFLFQEAYKLRSIVPCQKIPTLEIDTVQEPPISAPPLVRRVGNRNTFDERWSPTEAFIDQSFASISNFDQYTDEDCTFWKENISKLDNDELYKTLVSRLSTHLLRNSVQIQHPLWDWVFSNLRVGAAILKMNRMVKDAATIKKSSTEGTLFSPSFVTNHEVFSERNKSHHGSYLAKDTKNGTIIRSGSASVGCNQRVNVSHPKGAKQTTSLDQENAFYSLYPDQSSQHIIESLRKGWFSDIEFFPGIIFTEEKKNNVQDLLRFSEGMVAYLNSRLGDKDIRYKKHRLVCYFFETIQELCLAPRDNVSSSLGFESFIIKINSGFGEEWIEQSLVIDDQQVIEMARDDDDGDVVMD